ncbi:olfactory receptor 2A12-like protein [Cricetulus griseus]|uniref:Olfactory receptor 2A12-like protein n=1 Tax=Cricetulus griseus TaxID=10029 RepID=A0A061IJ09_CRIGR|nr:olfactory receptor 2A12-like protein [Cricetulus griseus]
MYFFLCILAMLDLCYVTTTMPQMLVHLLAKSQTISFASCWLQMYVFGALAATECILFVVMAYDRYVAICYPLHYTVILNWGLCLWLAAGSCFCGFLSALLHTFFTMSLPYCGPNKVNHYFCEGPAVRSLACMDTHLIEMVDQILISLMSLTPISLIVASYVHIVMAILKIKSTQGRCKAFSTCASHLTVVTLFYVPASYMYMRPKSSYSPERDKQISLFYNAFTALLNPVVYSLRNKDIKGAFLKVSCFCGIHQPGPDPLDLHFSLSATGFQSSVQCIAVGVCLCCHQPLDESSRMAYKNFKDNIEEVWRERAALSCS